MAVGGRWIFLRIQKFFWEVLPYNCLRESNEEFLLKAKQTIDGCQWIQIILFQKTKPQSNTEF